MASAPFHLAFPVNDLEASRRFYVDLLGCEVGRECDQWIDFDFSGHQITAHLAPDDCDLSGRNQVDGKAVPVRHFGLVMEWTAWREFGQRLKQAGAEFYLQPQIRFAGKTGEQGTFFVRDPSGNMLEFKSFKDPSALFAR